MMSSQLRLLIFSLQRARCSSLEPPAAVGCPRCALILYHIVTFIAITVVIKQRRQVPIIAVAAVISRLHVNLHRLRPALQLLTHMLQHTNTRTQQSSSEQQRQQGSVRSTDT